MAAINLGRRGQLAVKIGGFVLLGILSFLFALQATFNYNRVKDKFLVEGLAGSYEVTVGEVSRGIMPGKFTLERVTLRSRPTKVDEVPTVMVFDTIEANVGVFALITGAISVDFEASIGGGTVTGSVELPTSGNGSFKLNASGHGIKGDALPQLREAIGLPLIGKVDLGLAFNVSKGDWRQATGSITLGCPRGCTLGDGQTKFKPRVKSTRSAAMMGEGVEFGRVDIDKLSGKVELKAGKLEVTKWDFESKDAELKVELGMKLGKRLKDAELVVGCFRFKATPALQAREPRTATAISLIGGILGPDGLFHVKLECQGGGGRCTYSEVKAKGKVCNGESEDGSIADGGKGKGPALTAPTDPKTLTDQGSQLPGADINPVPTFADAMPPPDAQGTGSAGSAGSGSGSADVTGSGSGSGAGGSAVEGAAPSQLTPNEGTRLREMPPTPPPEAPIEPPPEPPPPVAPRENE